MEITISSTVFEQYRFVTWTNRATSSSIIVSADGITWRDPIQLVDEHGSPIESADEILVMQ